MIISIVMPSHPNVTLFLCYISEHWTTARILFTKFPKADSIKYNPKIMQVICPFTSLLTEHFDFYFSLMGHISAPLIYTYSFGFSRYHLYTIIFTLYVNYVALCISFFTIILRRYKPFSYKCFVSCVFLQHFVFWSSGIFAFILPVLYVSTFL